MKLYLLRHGIAVDHLGSGLNSDWQRPLTKEGQKETREVAFALLKLGVKADIIVSSPLVRTVQTAEIIQDVLAKDKDLVTTNALEPGVTVSDVYKFLQSYNKLENIFLVGHEPDMGKIAATLLWAGPELNISFKKAAICRIDVVDIPPTSPGILKWFVPPKILCTID